MMHGQFIGTRRVRCGWAQHKTDGIVSMDPQVCPAAEAIPFTRCQLGLGPGPGASATQRMGG